MSDKNVVDLAKKRKKHEHVSQSELFSNIILKMNRSPLAPPGLADFPRRFHLVEDDAGRRRILEELDNRVVCHRVDEVVAQAIANYCHTYLLNIPGADISVLQAEACRKLWVALTDPLPEAPLSMGEKSHPGLVFHRLPFDAPPFDGPWPDNTYPRFAEFLMRCSEPRAVAAYIGSLFFPQADRQQYLYLYGDGQDGKGALLRMLHRLFAGASQATEPREKGDRFWNSRVYGKRLLMFADCATPDYFISPGFKSLTGGDPMWFEEKGKMGFTAVPTCKIIAASNLRPSITSQKSDLRRLIYVEVKPFADEALVAHYEELLLAEAEQIVRICKSAYLAACPHHGPIPCAPAAEVATEAEELYSSLFHQMFIESDRCIPANEVRNFLRAQGVRSDNEMRKLKAVWARDFGIQCVKNASGNIEYRGMWWKNFGVI